MPSGGALGTFIGKYHDIIVTSNGDRHIVYFDESSNVVNGVVVPALMYLVIPGPCTGPLLPFCAITVPLVSVDLGDFSPVINSYGGAGKYVSLAVDGLGHPHVSYALLDPVTKGATALRYAFINASGGWQIETIADGAVWHTSIAVDGNGVPHVSYSDGSSVRYAVRSGGIWTVDRVSGGQVQWTSIALTSNGLPRIAFNDDGLYGFRALMFAERSPLGAWQSSFVDYSGRFPGYSGSFGYWPSLALDSSNNPYISYVGFYGPAGSTASNVKLAYRVGGVWSYEDVDHAGIVCCHNPGWDDARNTTLALDAQRNVHVAYSTDAGVKHAVRAPVSNPFARWNFDRLDVDPSTILNHNHDYFSSAVGADGVLHVLYQRTALPNPYLRMRYVQIPSATDTTPPVVTTPDGITVPRTNPDGATGNESAVLADFLAGGSAVDDRDPAPVRLPPQVAGLDVDNTHVFSLGATTVAFRFMDVNGNIGSADAFVTVIEPDSEPPVLTLPADMTVPATSAAGAAVFYEVSVTDNQPGATVACNPPSGSTFPIGTTTVNCLAADRARNTTTGSFTITVRGLDLAFTITHTGAFVAGSTGAYTLSVTNLATISTFSVITVQDRLPGGLSFVSASGAGWTCAASGPDVDCANNAPLAPEASASITLTVAVDTAARGVLINSGSVNTAGDFNPANDVASDPTEIVVPPLVVAVLEQIAVHDALVLNGTPLGGGSNPVAFVRVPERIGVGDAPLVNGTPGGGTNPVAFVRVPERIGVSDAPVVNGTPAGGTNPVAFVRVPESIGVGDAPVVNGTPTGGGANPVAFVRIPERIGVGDVPDIELGNTPTGTDVIVWPIDEATGKRPVSVKYARVTDSGITSLVTTNHGEPPPAGFQLGVPPVYFNVTTTAGFEPPVDVCFNYAGIEFKTAKLDVFHFENGEWRKRTLSLDVENKIICARVESLSPFAIFESANRPPVAVTRDLTRAAGAACMAEVTAQEVDAGSFDPDGDAITMSLNPPGPFSLGTTKVTLTVTDASGAASSSTATVSVIDSTPPAVTASLSPARAVNRKEGLFEVGFTANDACDAAPAVLAVMQAPAGAERWHVVFDWNDRSPNGQHAALDVPERGDNREGDDESTITFDIGKRRIVLNGRDLNLLRELLAAIFANGGAAVAQAQQLHLHVEDDRRIEFVFKAATLVKEKGRAPTLRVTARDRAGNAAAATAVPVFGGK